MKPSHSRGTYAPSVSRHPCNGSRPEAEGPAGASELNAPTGVGTSERKIAPRT
jgi:hypothetical protein